MSDDDHLIIGKTTLGSGSGEREVSTIWTGTSDTGAPRFETAVFLNEQLIEVRERYATEAGAREGHDRHVALVRAELADTTDDDRSEPRPDQQT